MSSLPRLHRPARPIEWLQYAFLILGLTALGYCIATYTSAFLFQRTETRKFVNELQEKKAMAPAEMIPREGAVIGRLRIPRLKLAVMVVQGDDERDLKRAAGHIPGTALPGQAGNVGIAGHRDTFFRPLRGIRYEDKIVLSTLRGEYFYRVVSTEVASPERVDVLYPTKRDSLTLVTCFPFDYVGSAPMRFIVRAERITGA